MPNGDTLKRVVELLSDGIQKLRATILLPVIAGIVWWMVLQTKTISSGPIVQFIGLTILVGIILGLIIDLWLLPTRSPTGVSNAVLFDEAHGQSGWTWYGMPPTIGEGYRRLKELTEQHYTVAVLRENEVITATKLREYAAFVLPIGPGISAADCKGHHLKEEEVDAIHKYVRQGGGLLVLSYFTGDWHHGANLNDVLKDYGIMFNNDVVMPKDAKVDRQILQTNDNGPGSGDVVVALPAADGSATNRIKDLLVGVNQVATLWSCSLYINPSVATAILHSRTESTLFEPIPREPSCLAAGYRNTGNGQGYLVGSSKDHKVIAVGSWRTFLNEFIDDPDYANRRLYENVLSWLTAKRGGGQVGP